MRDPMSVRLTPPTPNHIEHVDLKTLLADNDIEHYFKMLKLGIYYMANPHITKTEVQINWNIMISILKSTKERACMVRRALQERYYKQNAPSIEEILADIDP